MPLPSRRSVLALAALAFAGAAIVAGTVWSGLYDIGADSPHSRPVFALLESVRERSIAVRAAKLDPPDLSDAARIRHGAGNYAHMCAGCHRVPGGGDTELSRGLYPAPTDLTREGVDARAAFWTIKHGIQASGMPAWGRSMDDTSMWNLVAFVQELPRLDANGYAELVAASGGHAHGGGAEGGADAASPPVATTTHVHADGKAHEHVAAPTLAPTTHVHADGKTHVHAAAAPADAAVDAAAPEADNPPADPPAHHHDH